MNELSELLDEVGFQPKNDMNVYTTKVFAWMQQATREIIDLQWRVKTLTEVCEQQQTQLQSQNAEIRGLRGFANITADAIANLGQ